MKKKTAVDAIRLPGALARSGQAPPPPCAIQDDGEWVGYGGVLTPEWRSSGTVHTGGNLAEDFFEAWVAAEGREGLVGGDVEDHVVVGGDGGFEIGHGFLFSP